eukprot:1371110-Amorphochlora_amoeboformis.AAC.2
MSYTETQKAAETRTLQSPNLIQNPFVYNTRLAFVEWRISRAHLENETAWRGVREREKRRQAVDFGLRGRAPGKRKGNRARG